VRFLPTKLKGSYVIQIDPLEDDRGFFARLWCREEFLQQGIVMDVVQANVSHNALAGTLRGLHFQWPPSREAKLVRCERGRICDVIVDLRPDSPTFMQHVSVDLDSRYHNSLYVPAGFAHGFQTLEPNSDVVYLMSDMYQPELADGVRFDDPAFGIDWPLPISSMSDRDRALSRFDPTLYRKRYFQGLKPGGEQT
jgi:dTDP-4-dehydrorhamnose 3,5-epimerase